MKLAKLVGQVIALPVTAPIEAGKEISKALISVIEPKN